MIAGLGRTLETGEFPGRIGRARSLAESGMTDQELNARFEALKEDMSSSIAAFGAQVKAEIRAEIKGEGETTRRYFDVVAEGLRSDIRVIAEGDAALRDDVAELKVGQSRLEGRQERL